MSSVADDLSVFDRIKKNILNLIKAVPDRVIFGSDYGNCNQKQHIQAIVGLNLETDISEKVFSISAEESFSIARKNALSL